MRNYVCQCSRTYPTCFQRHNIPTAIMGLEILECLNLSKCPLRLWDQCLAVLRSLPKLRILEMRKKRWYQGSSHSPYSPFHRWDAESRELMDSLAAEMPELDVQIEPA